MTSTRLATLSTLEASTQRYYARDKCQRAGIYVTPRVQTCGDALSAAVGVDLHPDGLDASFSGVESCSSVHSCMRCAPAIRQGRAVELAATIDRHRELGGRVFFVTLTASHSWDSLADSLDCLQRAWSSIMWGRGRKALDGALGATWITSSAGTPQAGFVRAVDITHGANGWHPHYHVVVFTSATADEAAVRRHVVDRWMTAVRKHTGREAALWSQDCVEVGAGASGDTAVAFYAVKAGVELFRSDRKVGLSGSISPWQAALAAADGDRFCLSLWREYERTMHGRHASQWSRALASWARVDMSPEADAELVVTPAGSETVGTLSTYAYNRLHRWPAARRCVLREYVVNGDEGVRSFLADMGLDPGHWQPSPARVRAVLAPFAGLPGSLN